ncbi:hypothetical protein M0R04_15795 [Candidatus Dojkabacteria bacterium]|jgi:hypothetical protein|nr:hypothetical protein [Candidatus Dojkabacteria bacterium]
MTWTLCTSGAAIANAGSHADNTIVASAATLLNWCTAAEGFICMETHTDFVANYSTQNVRIKGALNAACAAMVAMDIIKYNPRNYVTREADMLMNANYERYSQAMKYLSIKQNQKLE